MPDQTNIIALHQSIGEIRANQRNAENTAKDEYAKAEIWRGDFAHNFNEHMRDDKKGFDAVEVLGTKVEKMIPLTALIPGIVDDVKALVTIKNRTVWTLGGIVLAVGFFKDVVYKIFQIAATHVGG